MMQRAPLYPKRKTVALILSAVFLACFCTFLFYQSKPVFPDPDSFYHAKDAILLSRYGVFDSFPWLTFTSLARHYTDQHFLYHVFLIPFVTLQDPIFGAKLATVFLNSAFFTLVAALLIRFRVRWWWAFLSILFVTNPFLFRMNLVKAPGLSLILLCIGLWLLMRRRVWPLAALGFVYVWTYGGFVLLGVLGVFYAIASIALEWHQRRIVLSVFRRFSLRRHHPHAIWKHLPVRQVAAIGAGIFAGVLVNPYFPHNLFFYWQQLVQIGIVNFQTVVNVGGEWHPYGFVELLSNTVFVSIAVLLALVSLVMRRRQQSAESWALFFFAVFCFCITLKSRRYVELYVPFATLFAAFSLRDGVKEPIRALFQKLFTFYAKRSTLLVLLGVYVGCASLTVIIRDERQLVRDLHSGFSSTYLARANAWLKANTPEGSIVVQSDWDDFPALFYHNDHNRYIVGLDPTFMYQYDRVLYDRWSDLTRGLRKDDATHIITQDLKSTIVLVTKDHESFDRVMAAQRGFSVVYEDAEAKIYQLLQQPHPESE
jgi:hypothetical protein